MVEQVQAEALADRQAQQSAAFAGGWDEYTPISVGARVAAFDEQLNADPFDSPDARAEAQVQRLMGVA